MTGSRSLLNGIAFAGVVLAGLLGGFAPAQACPSGPRPAGDDGQTYIAACAGSDDHVVLTRPTGPLGTGFLVSATEVASDKLAGIAIKAGVSAVSNFIVNPDLHASAFGYANSTLVSTGGADGEAMVSFRDFVTFKSTRLGVVFFTLEYQLDGILTGTHLASEAAFGQAVASLNLAVGVPNSTDSTGAGKALDTEEGDSGVLSFKVTVERDIDLAYTWEVRGMLDVRAFGTATAGFSADFAADFGSTAKFLGMHFYTDASKTTELFDITPVSAFGFTYTSSAPDRGPIPEPSSLALLAAAIGCIGMVRRRSRA